MSRIYHAKNTNILLSCQENLIFLIMINILVRQIMMYHLYNTAPWRSAVQNVTLFLDQPLY